MPAPDFFPRVGPRNSWGIDPPKPTHNFIWALTIGPGRGASDSSGIPLSMAGVRSSANYDLVVKTAAAIVSFHIPGIEAMDSEGSKLVARRLVCYLSLRWTRGGGMETSYVQSVVAQLGLHLRTGTNHLGVSYL